MALCRYPRSDATGLPARESDLSDTRDRTRDATSPMSSTRLSSACKLRRATHTCNGSKRVKRLPLTTNTRRDRETAASDAGEKTSLESVAWCPRVSSCSLGHDSMPATVSMALRSRCLRYLTHCATLRLSQSSLTVA
jgi:hypothetical protein